jgi:agmatine deiminase
VDGLRGILREQAIQLRVICGTKDIWCRDYIPVPIGAGRFVQFRYAPDYLTGFEHLITRPWDIEPIPEIASCQLSEIILDGGNIVRREASCILTRKVIRENSGVEQAALRETLRQQLGVEDLILIPEEPGDEVGHADGLVRFAHSETVLVNDYANVAPSYGKRLLATLRRAGLRCVEIPYVPRDGVRTEIPPAFGNYANFLQVERLVIVPSYDIPEDDLARRTIRAALQDFEVVSLDCADLSMAGGALNCVRWVPHLESAKRNKQGDPSPDKKLSDK